MAHYSTSGLWTAERAHSPYEASGADCKDCGENVADADNDYCRGCGEPTCLDCRYLVADEPLCRKCFAASEEAAIVSLQNDPQVGDVFSVAVAA